MIPDELIRQATEQAELDKDAARYRWLRCFVIPPLAFGNDKGTWTFAAYDEKAVNFGEVIDASMKARA